MSDEAFLQRRIEALEAELQVVWDTVPFARAKRMEALEAALREIARQKLYEEMEKDWRDDADWQNGYEAIVRIARAALAPEQDK